MDVTARARALRVSPRKIGLVAALVRGRSVSDAITILEHTPKRVAGSLSQVIQSAVANAEHNHRLKRETLVIRSLDIGPGVRYKRFRPIAHGRAHPYLRRTSNVRVVLSSNEAKAKSSDKPAEKPKEAK